MTTGRGVPGLDWKAVTSCSRTEHTQLAGCGVQGSVEMARVVETSELWTQRAKHYWVVAGEEVRHVGPGYLTPATPRKNAKGTGTWTLSLGADPRTPIRCMFAATVGETRRRPPKQGLACSPDSYPPVSFFVHTSTFRAPSSLRTHFYSPSLQNPSVSSFLRFLVSVAPFCPCLPVTLL